MTEPERTTDQSRIEAVSVAIGAGITADAAGLVTIATATWITGFPFPTGTDLELMVLLALVALHIWAFLLGPSATVTALVFVLMTAGTVVDPAAFRTRDLATAMILAGVAMFLSLGTAHVIPHTLPLFARLGAAAFIVGSLLGLAVALRCSRRSDEPSSRIAG